MAHYTILTPYLDECGAVYVSGAGDKGAVIRLNDRASALWRRLAATGTCDPGTMPEDDRAFIETLLARRVIISTGDGDDV
ncbi:hypothetical protein [Actinomadura macra]|uniref:hypothetical protein n=1 Tax=Actinomadura macra TaxID=46164 RepID=UPI000A61DAA3|nr:hypothetical protein [Actinomadura macra]